MPFSSCEPLVSATVVGCTFGFPSNHVTPPPIRPALSAALAMSSRLSSKVTTRIVRTVASRRELTASTRDSEFPGWK
eukprot:340894-Rhodomonas_salina.5